MWVLFSFEGRIPRRVYWGATLASTVAFFMGYFVTMLALGIEPESDASDGVFVALYLPLLWITLALTVKRWHDRDKSAWWILIGLAPIIGPLWQFIELGCLRGTEGPNDYGPDPT